jgi:hypothetical protein
MDTAKLTKLAIGLGIIYAVYKFGPTQAVKAAALGAMGVAVGKQVPFVQDVL